MKELQDLSLKLPIQPLYMQLLVQIVVITIIYRFVDSALFAHSTPTGVMALEAIYYGIAMVTSTAFKHRRSYRLLGAKNDAPQLQYWVDFRGAILDAKLPKNPEALKALPWFIQEYANLKSHQCIYAPLMFIIGGLANALFFYWGGQQYWIFFASILLLFGIGLFWESKHQLSNIRELLDSLKVGEKS
jgi:hypothetical protein